MTIRTNPYDQPIGLAVPDWQGCNMPPRIAMTGRHCIVEPIDAEKHARQLFDANLAALDDRRFTYLSTDAFDDFTTYRTWLVGMAAQNDPMLHAILDRASNTALGVAAFMRIDAPMGVVEVGHINYAPALAQTIAGTEAMYLMMKRAFDELGYRRYEWKCDSLNEPSRAAAARYGFRFEGIFRNALVYKGRNRDTAWFSIIDTEWPGIKQAFETWLSPDNFDENGQQRQSLAALRTV
ncbi:GNAT family N-acetyltransferase [Thalassospira sp.]|uniref:GNAT family N-acetyltransferase n=1 Tax=Thalassospira sp. TaxID=1912094 RepID=UPI0027339641|nr:GNAT family protein [Thalassospira sp.]MDP2698309.1 GNAT family protein [Thalassospira sp.]